MVGNIYEGQTVNGLLNGFGRAIVNTGTHYIGYFKNNVAHGYGKLCMPNGYKEEGLFYED